jgi:hypothetical protein
MRYGIKGVFKFETTFSEKDRPRNTIYETRIINIDAQDDDDAKDKAYKIFSEDTWQAVQPVPEIAFQEQTFVGLSQVKDLRPLDDHEVWYEYADECPPLLKGEGA